MANVQSDKIVLTHWNAGVFRTEALPQLLPELAIYSLLYDEVLIREEDLLTNRSITRLLSNQDNFRIFSELLISGPVKLLRLPLNTYPTGRRFDPIQLPISARAEEHQIRRSYKGNPWKPARWEWQLFRRLDDVVTKFPSASRHHKSFEAGNPFADQLADILENRQSYRLPSHPVFRYLNERTADQFIAFCRDESEWIRFLKSHGVADPIVGPDAGFFRSAAYQCSNFLPTSRAIRRLVESVYAATYCDREGCDGRYGGSELIELPYRYVSENDRAAAMEEAIRIEVAPTDAVATIELRPGLAEVLACTRKSDEFKSLRKAMAALGQNVDSPLLAESHFREAWRNLSGVYADNSAVVFSKHTKTDHRIVQYTVIVYIATRVLGYLLVPSTLPGVDVGVVVDEAAKAAIEKLGPAMLNGLRALVKIPALHEQIEASVKIRCSTVPLTISGRPEQNVNQDPTVAPIPTPTGERAFPKNDSLPSILKATSDSSATRKP